MKLFVVILVLVSMLLSQVHSEESTGELAVLSAKFQSFINELGENTARKQDYSQELSSVMQKLHRIQAPRSVNKTISLEWHGGTDINDAVTPLRIVIVVSSFEGVYLNSGIGTFYSALTDYLVHHGHTVTIVYTNKDKSDKAWERYEKWKTYNEKRGVVVTKLDPPTVHVTSPTLAQKSYHIYQHLKQRQEEFDIVHFPDWEGPGFFSLVAKHQKLAFNDKLMVVGLHGPWRWVKHANQDPIMTQETDLETDYLEQRSVELADVLVTPSRDLPQWLGDQGWNMPATKSVFLMPFLPGKEVAMLNQRERPSNNYHQVNELVFFGRLEERKGLKLFADSLDVLATRDEAVFKSLKITFLGRNAEIDGQPASDYIKERAEQGQWSFATHFITYKDRKHSLEYLAQEGRLAVMPSLVDNAPYTVYECLYTHIPFISSDLPSISALIQERDHADVLFIPNSENLAEILARKVQNGATVANSVVQPSAAVKSWDSFYNKMARRRLQTQDDVIISTPTVSVCIPFYNRPHLLPMTIQSIREQDYPMHKIEVVLVDDGSTTPAAMEYIDSIQNEFAANGWKIIRTENRYLGAARNTAARAASGEYLLFLDDDNVAHHRQLSTYVAVASATSADIITAAHDVFRGTGDPIISGDDVNVISRSVPLGAAVSVGIYKNVFGDANFFTRREVFLQTGGFTEERGVGQEEHEWLAKAVLNGRTLEAIPESLLYYRMHDKNDQMIFNTNPVKNQARSVRPYASVLDEEGDEETNNLLRMLAHKRVETLERETRATGPSGCNTTLISVTPTRFLTYTRNTLRFTVMPFDCQISSIAVGNLECQNMTFTNNSVTCMLQPTAFNGTYSVSLLVQGGVREYAGLTVTFLINPNVYQNTAIINILYYTDLLLYTQAKFINILSTFINQPGSVFQVIQDLISPIKRTRATQDYTEQHLMTLWIVVPVNQSNVATTPSPSSLAEQLVQTAKANKDALFQIGVTLELIDHNGDCKGSAGCSCSPNYAGGDCGSKAACPNSCSSNGDCIDGPFGRVCECYAGHVGASCNYTTCLGDCNGNGKCVLKIGSNSQCDCNYGWSGDGCTIAGACPNNCNGFGTCKQGLCVCLDGYSGVDCSNFDVSYIRTDTTTSSSTTPDSSDPIFIWLAVAVSIVGALFIAAIVMFFVLRNLRKR